jgi:predicted GIY-YIG superfamily endonuclease
MPKVPIDYKNTIIYKIEHIEDDNLVYVGHTTNWDRRKYQHKQRCKMKMILNTI